MAATIFFQVRTGSCVKDSGYCYDQNLVARYGRLYAVVIFRNWSIGSSANEHFYTKVSVSYMYYVGMFKENSMGLSDSRSRPPTGIFIPGIGI